MCIRDRSKAPEDLDKKDVGELEELASRLAKENDDLKKAAEEGTPNLSAGEQKKLDEILSKDPSKLSVDEIKDLEDMTSKLSDENAALRKPLDSEDNKRLSELLSKAPRDLDEKDICELEELTSRLAKENDDLKNENDGLKKAAEEGAPNLSAGEQKKLDDILSKDCLLYTSPSPRDLARSRMPSSA